MAIAVAGTTVLPGVASAQSVVFATHDWTQLGNQEPDTWADVKKPGNGRTYSVGTTFAGPSTMFSNGSPAYPAGPFSMASTKQVVIVQVAEPGQPNGIRFQAYFYGQGSLLGGASGAPTFARAISVWPAPTDAATRIAICGSTREVTLPLGPATINTSANIGSSGTPPFSGFVAVYDGSLTLLWLYHFFADDPNAVTTITDVSIRVEPDALGQDREYVTYCGVTNNGNPFPGGPVSTMLPAGPPPLGPTFGPFAAPPSFMGDTYAGGDSDNGAYVQYDGIVGRVSSPLSSSTSPGTPTLDFHSIVGGVGNDALLGLSQKSLQDFVVVGVTQGSPVPGTLAFPLTVQDTFGMGTVVFNSATAWVYGVAMQFAAPTPANMAAALQLVHSRVIGTSNSATIARDVLWQDAPGRDFVYVVGSTDFAQLAAEFPNQTAGSFNGAASGYLLATDNLGPPLSQPVTGAGWTAGRYIDAVGAASSGAMGVAAWNEYHDHIAVSGWRNYPGGITRMFVSSCFKMPGIGLPPTPPATWTGIQEVRQLELDGPLTSGTRTDYPGTADTTSIPNALNATPFGLLAPGTMTSGGIAVDQRGRITVVGSTEVPTGSSPFPIVGPPGEIRNSQGVRLDALRVEVDMLPYGVCRIDDTVGGCGPSTTLVGGTTPTCALSQFGNALAPATLERMFIDVEGLPASNASIAILLDRPISGVVALSALWLGTPVLTPGPPGIEVFGDITLAVTGVTLPLDESWRYPLPTALPSGPATFTIQFLSLFLPWNYCTAAPGCATQPLCQTGAVFDSAASPALLFQY